MLVEGLRGIEEDVFTEAWLSERIHKAALLAGIMTSGLFLQVAFSDRVQDPKVSHGIKWDLKPLDIESPCLLLPLLCINSHPGARFRVSHVSGR